MAGSPDWQRDQLLALRRQLTDVAGPHSPLWRERFRLLGRTPSSIKTLDDLASLPALGERDVSPTGDPADMAALVVHGSETGFALHAPGPVVRRALWARIHDRDGYRRIVDSEMRATTFAWTGLGFRWPVAYTRGDLDVLARAGARAFGLAGLGPDDAILTVAPPEPTPAAVALTYAALATGTPLVVCEPRADAVAASARLTPPTVFAVPPDRPDLVAALDGESPPSWDRVLLLGAPTDTQRDAVATASGGRTTSVWHVPGGGRVAWVECRQGGTPAGLHSQPDLEIVQFIDAETANPVDGPGEVVLTQLGMRGSAQLRWRTGDLAEQITTDRCPGCGKRWPRLVGLTPGALVAPSSRHARALDLRAVAAALTARTDVDDWRIVAGPRHRDGAPQVVVHLAAADPASLPLADLARELRAAAGALPDQIVLATPAELAALPGRACSARIRIREGGLT